MLKALCPRAAIKLCRCLHVPSKSIKFFKNRIQYPRPDHHFKYKVRFLNSDAHGSNVLPRSKYCTSVILDDGDSVNDGIEDMLDESHEYLDHGFMQIKEFLYKNLPDNDELLIKINNCNTEDVFWRTLTDDLEKCSRPLAILSLVKLWHCRNTKSKMSDETNDVKNDEDIDLLLQRIEQHSSDMNVDELTLCFLYLTKLTVNMKTDVMSTILERILKLIENGENDIPLTALSRFAVAVHINPQLYTYFIIQSILPHVLHKLDRVTTSEDLRLLTICLTNSHQLVSADTIELFRAKVYEFIADGKLKDDSRTILKILQFLCFPYWSQVHLPLVRTLLFQLHDKIKTFSARELEFVGMLFQVNFEPAVIGKTIATYASDILEKNPTAEVLSCTVLHSTPASRQKLTKLAKEFLNSNESPDITTLKSFFKIIRHLKISDPSICNEYWSKVQRMIMANPSQQENNVLAKYCHRYMHFNNNLNGTYRHIPFEKAVVALLVKDFDKGISSLLPTRFSKSASFILSYGHTPRDRYIFPEFIVQKIEAMQEQFTIFDCLQLTRGVEIALQMRFKSEIHQELAQQIVRLENVFNACTERHLNQPNLSLNHLNIIVRSYTNRKSTMRTSIYRKIIEKYETVPHQPLTSRIIRDITFNLNYAKYNIPNVCNSISEYVEENHEFVLGDTVQKVLYCFYNLNFHPKNDNLCKCATDVINRDFDTMSGLAVVEACLALAFYKELPGSLIDRVFNISFIQRLEDEIEMCYSKDFYPQRVLNSVMQLNRAVCLDFPENGVPWFQQNYIEAQLTKLPLVRSKFHVDVKDVLINLTNDENLLKVNHITPYGYRIDFVIYFDKHKKMMIPPTLNDAVLQVDKTAILLLDSDSFCQNDSQNVRGKQALKQRHLEIMGFKVVQINYNQWYSMYMNLPGAKIDYVRGLLS